MCAQLGQFGWRMSYAQYIDFLHEWKHIQKILAEKSPAATFHTITGKRCWIITEEDPNKLTEAQFGYYLNYRGKLNWRFNIRCEGGYVNESEDPKYAGPWEIFSNPYGAEGILKRRCVIPVNFFIEQPLGGKPKKKFIIRKKSAEEDYPTFFIGAIYDWQTDTETGEMYAGFSIITTAAAPIMEPVLHPRSPLIIPYGRVLEFLDPTLTTEQICSFFGPFDSSTFETFEVDPVIAKRTLPVPENDESLLTPISEVYPG